MQHIERTLPTPHLIKSCFLLALLATAGCKSAEEKAETYFKSGLNLLSHGDEDRALVELRNVFKHDGFHKEARQTYADILMGRGETREAYGQYLRLIEQYPDTLVARQILAEIAFQQGNWAEVERHGKAASALAPNDRKSQAIQLSLAYRDAIQARNDTEKEQIALSAERLLIDQPNNLILRRILADFLINGANPEAALPQIDAALSVDPENYDFHSMKLRLLASSVDVAGVGHQLQTMVTAFPQNEELKQSLIRWYLTQNDIGSAETFLRNEAGDLTADPAKHLRVVQLLQTARGRAAAREELTRLIAANSGVVSADIYRSALATLDFEDGQQAKAIKALETIVETAEKSDQTRSIMVSLAQFFDATGQKQRAKDIIDKVLSEDATHVDALKQHATWAILDDRTGEAIINLRMAQSQAPRDKQIMTLLAAAFERDGSLDLAGEQLAKAVEASGSAPDDSLRYARFLRQQGRHSVAETILENARRASPLNPSVLVALAEILLEAGKWPQVQEIAHILFQIGQPETLQASQQLRAAVLLRQNRIDEGLNLLEEQSLASEGDVRPAYVVVNTQLRLGKPEAAREFLNGVIAQNPGSPALQLLSANLHAVMGNSSIAEQSYKELIAKQPTFDMPIRLLYGLLIGTGRDADAAQLLEEGLVHSPKSAMLLRIKAEQLEKADDIDAAISVYEKLYQLDTSNIISANNLASMLSTHRDTEASLDRAFSIARRLRGTSIPAFQDTYGWIEYRRGNLGEALRYLESAAAGLPHDPLVQFHLGMVYADMGRAKEAAAQFHRALDLGEGRNLPQMERAQQRLAELTDTPFVQAD